MCVCVCHWCFTSLSTLVQFLHETTSPDTKYTTQSHYLDTGLTSPGFILLMLSFKSYAIEKNCKLVNREDNAQLNFKIKVS